MPLETTYSDEVAFAICEAVATSSLGLNAICASNPDWPSSRTFHRWKDDPANNELRRRYARAKDMQADLLADEALEIADSGERDYVIDPDKGIVADHDHIARSRLRVETRKWLAGKLAPRRFGDKLELSGDSENPVALTGTLNVVFVDPAKKGDINAG